MNRVNEVTKDCFNALVQIRNLSSETQLAPEMFHQRLIGFIDEMINKGKQLGMQERDTYDMAYAIVALADEIAQRKPGGIREVWLSRPLQLHYFNENIAGEGFFYRLEHIMRDPSRMEVLVVYYLCLMFGFQGRYAIRGGELELSAVIRRVQETLGRLLKPEGLSRRHLRPRERYSRGRIDHITVWLAFFGILFAMVFVVVLRLALDARSQALLDRITKLLTA